MKPEFCISYDSALGRMGNAKIRRSMSNLPTIKIDKAKDLVCDENEPVIVRRSSYKSVLPKKLSRFQAQVSQVSHADEERGRVKGRGRLSVEEGDQGSKVCRRRKKTRKEGHFCMHMRTYTIAASTNE